MDSAGILLLLFPLRGYIGEVRRVYSCVSLRKIASSHSKHILPRVDDRKCTGSASISRDLSPLHASSVGAIIAALLLPVVLTRVDVFGVRRSNLAK